MANQYISLRHLRFLLHEVFDLEEVLRLPYFSHFDRETIDMTLDAAKQIGDQYLYPHYREMDREKAYFKEGCVYVHPSISEAMQVFGEGGWISASDHFDVGGQQMPSVVLNAATAIFYAANANITAYAFLTRGAANLLRSFGSETLQEQYVGPMYEGRWQGTMALTEPQAGSSLSDIRSVAVPTEDGAYEITGQKIYISGGDYHTVENVVHLLLARIEGAPAGTKGVSLFAVPKMVPENGVLVDNHVTTAGIYGKMGQRGYVAAHLMLGEQGATKGYLVGAPHRGLGQMFQMMNEARIGTGLIAAAQASAAYYASLQYAKERPQGRHPSNKDVHLPQVLIIEHADVKRMLLFQKAVVEGSLALLMQCSFYADLAEQGEGEVAKRAHLLLELLTPVAKSYPAEMGNLAVSTGIQVLGGAGYTNDFPLEQYYRDIRINSIYEGTTTIHGMDLLGRKLLMENGAAAQFLMQEIQQTMTAAGAIPEFSHQLAQFGRTLEQMQVVIGKLIQLAQSDRPEVFLADATLFLEYFGLHVLAWQWMKQAVAAQKALQTETSEAERAFYEGKLLTFRYFFAYELVKESALRKRLLDDDRITLEAQPAHLD